MTHKLLDGLSTSPDVFIHQFDIVGDRALIIRLDQEPRRQASFLDDRILGPGVEGGWAPWAEIEAAALAAPPAKAGFIFHIGHCGSTLISRLIEVASGVRSLREPQPLRQFATVAADLADGLSPWTAAELQKRIDLYLRTASAGETTIIKATSYCGDLVNRMKGAAAFCYSTPQTYIAAMLGGANNPLDLRLHAPLRLRRLRTLCAAPVADLATLTPGEVAAMSWACETATMAAAHEHDAQRIFTIDFDAFLRRQEETLAALLAHFSLTTSPDRIRAALTGPTMRTYSKDSSFDYSPEDRRVLLAEYAAAHKAEIARGRQWLELAAKAHKPVAAALDRFGI